MAVNRPRANLDEYLAYVDANYERLGFHVEVTGDPVVSLDGDEYVVVQQDAVKATGLRSRRDLRRFGSSKSTVSG